MRRRARKLHGVAGFACVALALITACTNTELPNRPVAASTSLPVAPPPALADLLRAVSAYPLSDAVEALPAAMAATGDPRWVPYLLDLLRVGPSNFAQDRALEALAPLTGITDAGPLGKAYLRFGAWYLDHGTDPGPEYPAFKRSIYSEVDQDYDVVLQAVADRKTLGALQWGGVPFGGIRELNNPPRADPATRSWAEPDELVITTKVRGEPVGYPLRVIGRHELSNDVIGGLPVVVSFCTLCRTATVFERTVGGRDLNFQTSGLLFNSNKVMVDRETSSFWQQLTGEAIAGPLLGTKLRAHAVETMTWKDWRAEEPTAAVVDLPEPWETESEWGNLRLSYEYSPRAVQPGYYASPELWYPIPATPSAFPLKAEVATLSHAGGKLAVELGALRRTGPVVLAVGSGVVAAVPTAGGARFYDASPGGYRPGDALDPAVIVSELARLENGQSFWFAWFGAHPDTNWWPR